MPRPSSVAYTSVGGWSANSGRCSVSSMTLPLGVVEPSRARAHARRTFGDAARGTSSAVERRAAHRQRGARRADRHDRRRVSSTRLHQALLVALGERHPQYLVRFFLERDERVRDAAACASSTAFSLASASSCRSFSSSFGLRPGFCDARPACHAHRAAAATTTGASCRCPPCEAAPRAHRARRSRGRRRQPSRSRSFSDAENRRRLFGGTVSTDAPFTARSRCLRSSSVGEISGSDNWRCLRHVSGTILRPSVQRYPEGAVSRHVGREGGEDRRRLPKDTIQGPKKNPTRRVPRCRCLQPRPYRPTRPGNVKP